MKIFIGIVILLSMIVLVRSVISDDIQELKVNAIVGWITLLILNIFSFVLV